jgi:hypothetical protein
MGGYSDNQTFRLRAKRLLWWWRATLTIGNFGHAQKGYSDNGGLLWQLEISTMHKRLLWQWGATLTIKHFDHVQNGYSDNGGATLTIGNFDYAQKATLTIKHFEHVQKGYSDNRKFRPCAKRILWQWGATLTIGYFDHMQTATLTIGYFAYFDHVQKDTLTIEYFDHMQTATLTIGYFAYFDHVQKDTLTMGGYSDNWIFPSCPTMYIRLLWQSRMRCKIRPCPLQEFLLRCTRLSL